MERTRSRIKEINYWKEVIKKLENINENFFTKKHIKENLLKKSNEIKNNLERGNIREAKLLKDKFIKQIIDESRVIERSFKQVERDFDFIIHFKFI